MNTPYFTYLQNNSGGSFKFDKAAGITRVVIVQARDKHEADRRAENIGLYWSGVSLGIDCDCCGNRWSPAWEDEGKPEPSVYGSPVHRWMQENKHTWMTPGHEVCIHHEDGRKEWL